MTSKIQIDPEMVQRFERAALKMDATGAWVCHDTKAGLDAALNPPEEPEIPVSEGMIAAGRPHIIAGYEEKPQYYCIDLAAIYRAMEKARRKEEEKNPAHGKHRRHDDDSGYIPPLYWRHRRKDDPK